MGKVRDSGMPEEKDWASFFDVEHILDVIGLGPSLGDIVEFGCGYGTFTLPAARRINGLLYALEIEPELVRLVDERGRREGLSNLIVVERDFAVWGTGLEDASVDAALQFNILHHEQPVSLMAEAWRVLKPEGQLAVLHWKHDLATSQGPDLTIRPSPEQCIAWGQAAGFAFSSARRFDFGRWHYGLLFTKDS